MTVPGLVGISGNKTECAIFISAACASGLGPHCSLSFSQWIGFSTAPAR
jgi:hypothetical protein